ncbi:anaerobic C4-dicarboxylate transporter family protein [bacterium]|nr:anaerobic C4-dicarboxylate transporter family protein [bacterium]
MDWELISVALQGLTVLICLGIGARMGGVAVGLWGGIGVILLSSIFHLPPGDFPISAMSIIFAVVTGAGAMQVAGGIDYLVNIAQRILKKNPRYITFLAPYVSWLFTIGAGTGNVYYSLLPVIEEISYRNGIRPERPLALSPEASQLGITSSPVSAAMAIMLGFLAPSNFSLGSIMLIVLPSTIIAIFVAAFIQNMRGQELEDDPHYQKRLQEGLVKKPAQLSKESEVSTQAKWSTWLFIGAVVIVVVFGFFESLRPQIFVENEFKPVKMTLLITMVMMAAAVAIIKLCHVDVRKIPSTKVFQSGMVSVLALMGIAWMANTFVGAHKELFSSWMQASAAQNVFILGIAFYILAALTTSQSSTTIIIVPIALAMNIPPAYIVAMWMAVIGIHFFPASGSQIATIEFDRSGTTRIGRWVINHSFLVPNLIVAITAVTCAYLIATLFFV